MNTLPQIAAVIASELDIELPQDVEEQTTLEELDIDSLALLTVVTVLEESMAVEVTDADLAGLKTIGDLVALVREREPLG